MEMAVKTKRLNEIAVIEGELVTITLSRPERANALDAHTLTLIAEAMTLAERESAARSVVLCGSGKHFCAGADLKELGANPPTSVRSLLNLFREVTRLFEASPLIVIGAVQGAARAGGLELLLACDAVVAAEDATIGDAHLANGLLPGGGSSARLPRTIGHARARWMILSAVSIDAKTALDWGLCLKVVANELLYETAVELAHSMAVGHPEAVRRAKRMLNTVGEVPLSAMLESEIAILEAFSTSAVFRDGIGAFLDRKKDR
jgi:enoyl-CoA hydratase/carnithine racemase